MLFVMHYLYIKVDRYPSDEIFVVDVLQNEWKRYRANVSLAHTHAQAHTCTHTHTPHTHTQTHTHTHTHTHTLF